jgi:hypothetical protein
MSVLFFSGSDFPMVIDPMLLLPTERSYCTFKKENAFENKRQSARKIYIRCFSQCHPDILFTYLHR